MRFIFCFFFLQFFFLNSTLAAIKPISIDVYSHNSDDYLRVKIQPEIAVGTLLNEPLIACRAKWSFQTAHINGDNYPASFFPPTILKNTRLFSLQLIFQIQLNATFQAIACDPGYLDAPGSNEWSLTVTSSPAWDKLIRDDLRNTYSNDLQSQFKLKSVRDPSFLPKDSAKQVFQESVIKASPIIGSWVKNVALEQGEVNLWPLRNYLQEKLIADRKQEIEKQDNSVTVVDIDNIDTLFSDAAFDNQIQNASRVADNKSELKDAQNTLVSGRDKSDRQDKISQQQLVDYRRKAKVCMTTDTEDLQTLLKKTQACYKNGDELKVFEQHDLYGYKLKDNIVIEAQYTNASLFNNGHALVRKNDRLLSITPSGNVYKNLGDIKLKANDYSPQGLMLVKKDDKYGYINSKGDVVIALEYRIAKPFDELARAIIADDNSFKLINEAGIVLAQHSTTFTLKDGYYITSESWNRENGGCDEGDLVSYDTQKYTADGEKIGGLESHSYRASKICLQAN